jgi:hypothetical protein
MTAMLTLVAIWPQTLWPRSVPVLDVTVTNNPNWEVIAATSRSVESLDTANPQIPPVGNDCASTERQNWVQDVGGVPDHFQHIAAVLETRRKNTVVTVSDIKVTARRLEGSWATGIVPCPKLLGGGGNPSTRYIGITVKDVPEVTITDLDAKNPKLDHLDLSLINGESAEFFIDATTEEPGVGWEWSAKLVIVADGKEGEVRLPKKGYYRIARLVDEATLWSDNENPRICPAEKAGKNVDGSNAEWC